MCNYCDSLIHLLCPEITSESEFINCDKIQLISLGTSPKQQKWESWADYRDHPNSHIVLLREATRRQCHNSRNGQTFTIIQGIALILGD